MAHSASKIDLNDLAHDLRSPLASVRATAEATLLDESIGAETRVILKKVIDEVDKLAELTKQLYGA